MGQEWLISLKTFVPKKISIDMNWFVVLLAYDMLKCLKIAGTFHLSGLQWFEHPCLRPQSVSQGFCCCCCWCAVGDTSGCVSGYIGHILRVASATPPNLSSALSYLLSYQISCLHPYLSHSLTSTYSLSLALSKDIPGPLLLHILGSLHLQALSEEPEIPKSLKADFYLFPVHFIFILFASARLVD